MARLMNIANLINRISSSLAPLAEAGAGGNALESCPRPLGGEGGAERRVSGPLLLRQWAVMAAIVLFVFALTSSAQTLEDQQFKQAGVCARCHVISVVEWGMSRHSKAGTTCVACHGESKGHVKDERNNIKPEHIPHAAAIAGLCAGCHQSGCPKTHQTASCQDCHHSHALVNPDKPAVAKDPHFDEISARWQRYGNFVKQGEDAVKAEKWQAARAAFGQALKEKPGDRYSSERLRMCERRMNSSLAGFEVVGKEFDPQTGLPARCAWRAWASR